MSAKPQIKQALLLALLSVLVATPKLVQHGKNIVAITYDMGSYRLLEGTDPYRQPEGGHDYYKYSPTFALLYAPLSKMTGLAGVFCWAFLNAFIFWIGLVVFFRLSNKSPPWMWAGMILCSMEISGPLLYQQINPLLVGLILIGFALFKEKPFLSGSVLAFATNLKLLPIVFVAGLFWPFKPRYIGGVLAGTVLSLALPLLFLPFSSWLTIHESWIRLLVSDVQGHGILDVETVLKTMGWPVVGHWARLTILAVSGVALLLVPKKDSIWLSLGLACILLINHRTESPTFIFLAPTYLFLLERAQNYSGFQRHAVQTLVVFAAFLVTISYNDLWPSSLLNTHPTTNASKMWGSLIIWVLSLAILIGENISLRIPAIPTLQKQSA